MARSISFNRGKLQIPTGILPDSELLLTRNLSSSMLVPLYRYNQSYETTIATRDVNAQRDNPTQLQHEPFLLIGSWADFEYIDVSENFLTGKILPDMCKNGKICDIFDAAKQFHWWVVGEFCELFIVGTIASEQ
uniref:Uncharacterized protein n=1 Tax=Helianthus annuus TaxID=4232 RepID=A0A251TI07_HELAN